MEGKTQLDKIKEFMKGKEKVTIKEISEGTGIIKNSVMGCLNSSIKFNKNFVRLEKATYKLKEE